MPVENGYVPTPPVVADYVATTAFGAVRPPNVDDGRVLFPGLGTGNLFDAVRRYCTKGEGWYETSSFDYELPECVGVENDSQRIEEFHESHDDPPITVQQGDFLLDPPAGEFDWIVANPPFMRYQRIDTEVRSQYTEEFQLGDGKPGLHVLFLEQAYDLLVDGGWLTFIMPLSDFLNRSTGKFRDFLRVREVGPIRYLPQQTFDEKVDVVLVGLKKSMDEGGYGLWIESLYGYETREMVRNLGVDNVDAAVDQYYEEQKVNKRMMNRRDKKDRNVKVLDSGKIEADNPSRGTEQISLDDLG